MFLKLIELLQKLCLNTKEKIIDSCKTSNSLQAMTQIIEYQTNQLKIHLKSFVFTPTSYLERYFIPGNRLYSMREIATLYFSYCTSDLLDILPIKICDNILLLISEILDYCEDVKYIVLTLLMKISIQDLLESHVFELGLPFPDRKITKERDEFRFNIRSYIEEHGTGW
jgi:hypothetical protein